MHVAQTNSTRQISVGLGGVRVVPCIAHLLPVVVLQSMCCTGVSPPR